MMADLRIGGTGDSGIERFQALREEALRRSRSTAAGALTPGKTPASGMPILNPAPEKGGLTPVSRQNSTPDARSPLGRLIDLRA
jgi:hypothetical protein